MDGETDLDRMLADLTASVRDGSYVMAQVTGRLEAVDEIEALVREREGVTVVTRRHIAERMGWAIGFEGAWMTLDVHSSLEAVGLTAAVSTALASAGIPCNMLAGHFHDHLLVPLDRVDATLDALKALRSEGGVTR